LDDTPEIREQLSRAWRSTLDAAVANGAPPQAVVETMVTVAHECFAEAFGATAAASYLQLLAEQLRAGERCETDELVRGQAEERPSRTFMPADAEALIDPDWPTRNDLFG
jgi:hypothetical protein